VCRLFSCSVRELTRTLAATHTHTHTNVATQWDLLASPGTNAASLARTDGTNAGTNAVSLARTDAVRFALACFSVSVHLCRYFSSRFSVSTSCLSPIVRPFSALSQPLKTVVAELTRSLARALSLSSSRLSSLAGDS
jgi:hypothetical protein